MASTTTAAAPAQTVPGQGTGDALARLRDHGRPGEGDDVPVAVPARSARAIDCPIVGVAVDDWSIEDLRERARTSIEATGEKLDASIFDRLLDRFSYVSGDFTDATTYERVGAAIGDATTPVFYLEIPPFLFGQVVKELHDAGLTKNARVVVEKPFGHDLESARALAAELHQYIQESQLYRIDHYLGKMGVEEIAHLRFQNSILEPIWNRNHVDAVEITMAESFGVEDRGHFYDPVGALRDVVVNASDAGGGGCCDGGAVAARRGHAQELDRGAVPLDRTGESGALRPRPVRRLPLDRRRGFRFDHGDVRRRCGWRSRTGAGRVCRSSSGPASGSPPRRPSCA